MNDALSNLPPRSGLAAPGFWLLAFGFWLLSRLPAKCLINAGKLAAKSEKAIAKQQVPRFHT